VSVDQDFSRSPDVDVFNRHGWPGIAGSCWGLCPRRSRLGNTPRTTIRAPVSTGSTVSHDVVGTGARPGIRCQGVMDDRPADFPIGHWLGGGRNGEHCHRDSDKNGPHGSPKADKRA
jgi:hypothetical protein